MGKHADKRHGSRETLRSADHARQNLVVEKPLPVWLKLGVPLFFLAGCVFGVLDVHYSTDAWIGLAAGRDICAQPGFPTTDTWSYTFSGKTWVNQNWLSHLFFWMLYDRLGPSAVAIGTWIIDALIFGLVLAATWLRCRSWLAATLAAAMIAIATRDWLSPRPATIQLLLLALLWLSLLALMTQGERRRWWPVVLMVPVLAVWPHAHGSFIVAYAALGGYLAGAAAAWLVSGRAAISRRQALVITATGLVTLVLGVLLSPYGLENLLHPLVVAESEVFRQVNEWLPPYKSAPFPRVGMFWVVLAAGVASPILACLLRLLDHKRGHQHPETAPTVTPSPGFHALVCDVAAVAIGLVMAMKARRFIPIFYIVATPALVAWTLRLGVVLSAGTQRAVRLAVAALSWPAAAFTVHFAVMWGYQKLVVEPPQDRPYNLLERVTQSYHGPREAIDFLERNNLSPNVFTAWPVAGAVIFRVPGARVFIDGRSQQLFTERHVIKYCWLLAFQDKEEAKVSQVLEESGTDAVLLQPSQTFIRLVSALGRNPRWLLIVESPKSRLFVRLGSAFLDELGRRERSGELWWPDLPESLIGRGRLLGATDPKDPRRAAELWRQAVARKPELGIQYYLPITTLLMRAGGQAEATSYVQAEKARLSQPATGLTEPQRVQLLNEIQRCENLIARALPP